MTRFLRFPVFLYITTLLFTSCTDDIVIPDEPDTPVANPDDNLLYHDDLRTTVYPKLNNEIYLNPAPLIVPSALRGDSLMQFEVSSSQDFSTNTVYLSQPSPWSMANPHRRLEPRRWYWRYRNIAADNTEGPWSAPIAFDMPADAPEFITPTIEKFNAGLPSDHPRLEAYLNANLDNARKSAASHPEYRNLLGRAKSALSLPIDDIASYYITKAGTEQLNYSTLHLYQAYILTQDEQYADKLIEILHALMQRPATFDELFKAETNFQPTNIAQCYVRIYDTLFHRLSAAERHACEEFMALIVTQLNKYHMGKKEVQLFDSHFWQHNMMALFQCAYMLHDKAPYRDAALRTLDYIYELWVCRAPGTGFNRDGVWHNSASYFDSNIGTLHYMPLILGHISGSDFMAHPWYRSAGKAMPYTWPSQSKSSGFGDASDEGDQPSRLRVAFADFLARHLGDEYAGWYAAQCASTLQTDFLLRLERMVNAYGYSTAAPDHIDKLLWYTDSGEAVMHSDLASPENNLSVSFRSSRFGCTQHTYANQNAFNITYRGHDVFRNTGHYFKYGSAHHLLDSRHTRAHNTILVDGIGQAFSPVAYGNIVRGLESDNITYCMGDASYAYTDTSRIDAWIKNFRTAGLKQSRENGFGTTPLSKYQRHIFMLHPDIVVVYDDIEASAPARFSWLLNRRTPFTVEAGGTCFTAEDTDAKFAADASLFSSSQLDTDLTDRFRAAPLAGYANHWHYSATTASCDAVRFLFVLHMRDIDAEPVEITRTADGTVSVDGWVIDATLDSSRPARIKIENIDRGTTFLYNDGQPSTLTDTSGGRPTVLESTDYTPRHTRSN